MSTSSKTRKAFTILAALLLTAAMAAALAWYYDVYVNWQPSIFPFAMIAVTLAAAALTLLTLWARGERKAVVLLWKTALSTAVFAGVILSGVSFLINNVIGKEGMARQAANVALPLAAAQVLFLNAQLLRAPGKRLGRGGMALAITWFAAVLAASVVPNVVIPLYFSRFYRAPEPQLNEGKFEPMPALGEVDFNVPADGTIEEVRDLIRAERAKGEDRRFTVLIEDGEYNIGQIAFDERDHDTTYRSRDGGVILNGGMKLDPKDFAPWEKNENIQVIDLTKLGLGPDDWGKLYSFGAFTTAEKYDGGVGPLPCELFFNGVRCTTARYPNGGGWLSVGKVLDNGEARETYENGGTVRVPDWDAMRNPRGGTFAMDKETAARAANWATLDDVWMSGCFYHDWADMSTPVKAIDNAAGTVTAEYESMYGYRTGKTYYFYNVLEELDEPGEWYLDRDAGLLYLWPPEELEGARLDLSLSTETLLTGENVKNLSFIGLTLQGTRDSGIAFSGDGITVDHCLVQNVAGSGLGLSGYNNTASNNEIRHAGRGGISISGGDAETLTPGNSRAVNNLVHDWGEVVMTYGSGIGLYGTGNLVAHNEMYSAPHIAIMFGGNNLVIEYNIIHDVCLLTDDAGAMYGGRSFFSSWGTVIRSNVIYNLGSNGHTPDGIYLDDGLSGVSVLNNLLVNVPKNGIHLGGGRDYDTRGNIIVNSEHTLHYDWRAREAALSTDPNFWFSSAAPGGTMWVDLEASPWQTDAWRAAFPKLAAYSTDFSDADNPNFAANPAGSTVAGNLCVGGRLDISDVPYRFSAIGPNGIYGIAQMKALFADAAQGDYSVRPGSRVYKAFPAWEDIEIEKIGRVG